VVGLLQVVRFNLGTGTHRPTLSFAAHCDYRLHKPSGQAVVTLNGKDFYLGRWKSEFSQNQYDRLIAEWVGNGRLLPSTPDNGRAITIAELLDAYLGFAEDYYSRDGQPTSEYTAMKDAVRPVNQLYGALTILDFGPLALKAVRETMIDRRLARRHINQRVNRIRRVFKWGVENELVPAPILHGLQAVAPLRKGRCAARETAPIQPVSDEQVEAVLPYVARQVATMIQLQRLTGMRPGEVVLIRPCDVDRSNASWVYRPQRHKTDYAGHAREVCFGPQAQAILAPWLLRDAQTYCFSPAEAEAERNAVRRAGRKSIVVLSGRGGRLLWQPSRAIAGQSSRCARRPCQGHSLSRRRRRATGGLDRRIMALRRLRSPHASGSAGHCPFGQPTPPVATRCNVGETSGEQRAPDGQSETNGS
jgi:integrase